MGGRCPEQLQQVGVGGDSSAINAVSVNDDVDEILEEFDGEWSCWICGDISNEMCSLFKWDILMGDDGGHRTSSKRYPALMVCVSQLLPYMMATSSEKIACMFKLNSHWTTGLRHWHILYNMSYIYHFSLQQLSIKCGITLNDFCCITVSHSFAPHKSWDKHDLNEVASSILAHTILKNYCWGYQRIYQKKNKSWTYFYINITTLPRLWATLSKLCSVAESNLWPHWGHAYLSFCVARSCGWLWHNENHSTWFHISLKVAVNTFAKFYISLTCTHITCTLTCSSYSENFIKFSTENKFSMVIVDVYKLFSYANKNPQWLNFTLYSHLGHCGFLLA